MDNNRPVVETDDKNNSSPKSEISKMDTRDGVHDPSPVKEKADIQAEASASETVHHSDNDETSEKQTHITSESGEANKAEDLQTSKSSELYPVLSDVTQQAEQDSATEQAAIPCSMTGDNKPETKSDNETVCIPASKSNCEVVPNEGASDLNSESSKQSAAVIPSMPADGLGKEESSGSSEKDRVHDESVTSGIASAPPPEPEASEQAQDTATVRPDSLPTTSAAGAEIGAVGGKSSSPGNGESVYYVKWIQFSGSKVPIITQNENGPCPLLAIMNVLLLKGKVRLAPLVEMITSEQLMAHLGDCVVESKPKNLDEANRANYEQNMQDAMNLMYKLQTGLDVNVRFTGVSDFEYTSECIIFDLLEIALYHGWLVDPQDEENVRAVGKCSYNQLVERVIQNKQSDKDNLVQEALIAEQFLDGTASQLTYHGLCELSSTVKEQELCVFFRNNHFNTLYRHNNELFLLVTDQGFLTEGNVVWETLSNVDGDCHFVDANFCTYTKPQASTEPIATSPYFSGDEQINSDYQVALSLQHQDQQILAEQEAAWGHFHQEFGAAQNSDHELAMRLQEEEDRRAAAALQESRNQQAQAQAVAQGQGQAVGDAGDRRPREERREKKEGKDCCIL